MDLTSIPRVPGARHRRKRVGRGIGSGHGKTATRGQKGQRARTGSGKRPGFEGGRTPLIRRLPKRGFRQKATGRPRPTQLVHVADLERFKDGEQVTVERLVEEGLVRHATDRVKLLGDGTVHKRLTVVVHEASGSAQEKVAQAGGAVQRLAARAAAAPLRPATAQGGGAGPSAPRAAGQQGVPT